MPTLMFMSCHSAEVISAATSCGQVTPVSTPSAQDFTTLDAFQKLSSET